MTLKKKTIIFGITGGIAAFKVLPIITSLREKGHRIFVIMTNSAIKMIDPKQFEAASGNKVYSELFEKGFDYRTILAKREVNHIQLADKADLFVIIPATANALAKIAHGIADDFLTTSLLATEAPVLICPSMNVHMWTHPIVQKNISKIKAHGYDVVDPESGALACGYEGIGRLANETKILEEIQDRLTKTTTLKGANIIITAGGTKEPLDGVRFLTNRSSGKMGIALAEAAYQRGANVLLLRAKHAVSPRFALKGHTFETADDLDTLLKQYSPAYDVCIHTAAVADFSPEVHQGKISSDQNMSLRLTPRKKTIEVIKESNPEIKLITFKAEWGVTKETFTITVPKKIQRFNLAAVVVNDVSKNGQGFETDTNELIVVLKDGTQKKFPLAAKRILAGELLDYLFSAAFFTSSGGL